MYNEIDLMSKLGICIEHQNLGYCSVGRCKKCGVPNVIFELATNSCIDEHMNAILAHSVINSILKGN